MRLWNYDRVLWDFNGTLYDDLRLCLDSVNRMLEERALLPIPTEEAYREVFCFPVQTYYARVGLPSEGEAFVEVAHEWMGLYRAGEDTVPLRNGALEALDFIRNNGVKQGVLSATEQTMLTEQVTSIGILPYFDCVLGRGDIYATDKSDIAARYAAEHPTERVLMVGDTAHDYQTADAGNFDCVLVEGGHQSRAALMTCGCPVVHDFHALVTWLSETEK